MGVDFRTKKRYSKVLFSRVTLLVLIVLLLIIGKATWGVYQKAKSTRSTLSKVEERYEKLRNREQFLNEGVSLLATPDGVESEIRERFGLAREGESVIIIVEEEDESEFINSRGSLWARLKNLFSRD